MYYYYIDFDQDNTKHILQTDRTQIQKQQKNILQMCENSSFSKESVESLTSRHYQVYPSYNTKSMCRNQKDEF